MVKKGCKGIPQTAEAKVKIGLAMKRIALEQIARGTRKGLFKKGHSGNLNAGNHLGRANPNYKNGNFAGRIRKFREEIRKRDSYICQECFTLQKELKRALDVHHIDFDKENNNPNNLISLCEVCHAKTNFNRSEWECYFKKIISHITVFANSSSIDTPTLLSKKEQVGYTQLKSEGGRN